MLPISTYNFKAILEGGLSLLPGFGQIISNKTKGTDSARYCYSVWMRHLIKIHAYYRSPSKGLTVELGPGDSLGIGLAALLSGAEKYFAVDVVQHANTEWNMKVLRELIKLFENRAPIPNNQEFPEIKPHIDDFDFPAKILNDDCMKMNLDPNRLQSIADSVCGKRQTESFIRYFDPLAALAEIEPGSMDIVFSQAVLEHVEELSNIYRVSQIWLKPRGLMSHQIDFRSHGTSRQWNGHWAYPDLLWRLIRGKRPYLLNREPCNTHLCLLAENGFKNTQLRRDHTILLVSSQPQLAARFRNISQKDIMTAGIYVLAEKSTLLQKEL